MSVLATNMGFSAAITNPFTIGIAQNIAGLPLFSGAWFRILIFIVVYLIFSSFLVRYAKRVSKEPESSLVFEEDKTGRSKYADFAVDMDTLAYQKAKKAVPWFLATLLIIPLVLIAGPFVPGLSGFTLPLVGLVFMAGGLTAGRLSGATWKQVLKSLGEGIVGIAPGILLILMAVSVKHIVVSAA